MIGQAFVDELHKMAGTYGNSINAYHGAAQAAPGAAAGKYYQGTGTMPSLPTMRNNAAQELKSYRAEGPAGVSDAQDARHHLTNSNNAKAMALGGNTSQMWQGYSTPTGKTAGAKGIMSAVGKAGLGLGALGLAGYAGVHHEELKDHLRELIAARHPTLTATLDTHGLKHDVGSVVNHAEAASHEGGRRLRNAWEALKGNGP